MSLFSFGGVILDLLVMVFEFWNSEVNILFDLLGQSPDTFKDGGPWQTIEAINPIFVAIGSSLVVLFFVIGFCSESIDVKEEMRLERILQLLIRLGIAEFFVANNVSIMKAIFETVGNIIGSISGTDSVVQVKMTKDVAETFLDLGFGESLLMLIITSILSLVVIVCGFFLIYTVYFRFLKILIIVPLGSVAYSTMSGNHMLTNTAITYTKYFISVVFEAVMMALALIVCNSFLNAGLPEFTADLATWTKALFYVCEMTFTIALTVGSIKGAQGLTSKALGL